MSEESGGIGFVARPACPICAGPPARIVLECAFDDRRVGAFLESYYEGRVPMADLGGGGFRIAECVDCQVLWQVDILNGVGMAALYDQWISGEASLDKKRLGSSALFRRYSQEVDYLFSLFEGRSPHAISVLDFGMGWGYWCRMASAYNLDVTGLEFSKERVAFARSMGVRVVADVSECDGRRFDFINSEQVFEHIPAPAETMAWVAGHLNPGGVAHVAVPNGGNMGAVLKSTDWRASKDALHPLEHINCYSPRALVRLAEGAGLAYAPKSPATPPRKKGMLAFFGPGTNGGPEPPRGTNLYFRKPST